MVTSDDMESKIKEIERLVTEIMAECDKKCRVSTSCIECPLKTSVVDETGIRRFMCDKITGILGVLFDIYT